MHETDSIVALALGKRLKDWVNQASEPAGEIASAPGSPRSAIFASWGGAVEGSPVEGFLVWMRHKE